MRDRQEFRLAVWNYVDSSKEYLDRREEIDYRNRKPFQIRHINTEKLLRELVKNEIEYWLNARDMHDCYNRLDLNTREPFSTWHEPRKPIISIAWMSIFSSKGSISKRPRWLNKITVDVSEEKVLKHVARTDERFLGFDIAEDFLDFAITLQDDINAIIREVWNEYVTSGRAYE